VREQRGAEDGKTHTHTHTQVLAPVKEVAGDTERTTGFARSRQQQFREGGQRDRAEGKETRKQGKKTAAAQADKMALVYALASILSAKKAAV